MIRVGVSRASAVGISLLGLWSWSAVGVSGPSDSGDDAWIRSQENSLVTLYRELHRSPELSLAEVETSRRMASELRAAGANVTENVGGHGVVGVLKNGTGPTVMIRADMDALPVSERTGLEFASKVVTTLPDGTGTGVMHACGHDVHMSVLIGTARWLSSHRDAWSGTALLVAQPAEERAMGATAMLKDRLFTRFPKPTHAIAYHVTASIPAGRVGWVSGPTLASATTVDVRIKGRGGHGALPHLAIDPIVMAAEYVTGIQTIVSRSMDPTHPAVLTVGMIHGGTKHNIIPDSVTLGLSIRAFQAKDREMILSEAKRRAETVAASRGAPAPDFTLVESVGETTSDPELVARLVPALRGAIGDANVVAFPPVTASEDFGGYAVDGVTVALLWLGAANPKAFVAAAKSGKNLPNVHSAEFAPDAATTIATGVKGMAGMVTTLMPRR